MLHRSLGVACFIAAALATVKVSRAEGAVAGVNAIVEEDNDSNHRELQAFKPLLKILHLGDSFSSGNAAKDYGGIKKCYRSQNNFGSLYGERLEDRFTVRYVNKACSGATTQEFFTAHRIEKCFVFPCIFREGTHGDFKQIGSETGLCHFTYHVIPQREQLQEDVDLVLLSIGRNDLSFDDVISKCYRTGRAPHTCKSADNTANGRLLGYVAKLKRVLIEIKDSIKPDGKVVLVSYPHFQTDTPFVLRSFLGLNGTYDVRFNTRQLIVRCLEVQRGAVDEANLAFPGSTPIILIDSTIATFAGHEPNPARFILNKDRFITEIGLDIKVRLYNNKI